MNKTIKIILLIVAVVLAIGGVLLYIKTIVTPPRNLTFNNQFEQRLAIQIDSLRKCNQANLELNFATLTDLTHRFKDEDFINNESFDANYLDVIGAYTPKFAQYCFAQFRKSVWDNADLQWMADRIDQLRDLTVEDGSQKIMAAYPETDGQFTIILKTIRKYRDATALTKRTGYAGWYDARTLINQAKEFKQDDYLQNNAALMKALNMLPNRLEESHFAWLRSQVRALANYTIYDKATYETITDKVLDALNDYKQNAYSVYGTSRNIDELKNEAGRYYELARNYYASKIARTSIDSPSIKLTDID